MNEKLKELEKRVEAFASNHFLVETAKEFSKEGVAIYSYESDGSHAYMTLVEKGSETPVTLEITGTEAMALDVNKEFQILELWAHRHGMKYYYDYNGRRVRTIVNPFGRIDEELKSTEDWRNELQHKAAHGYMIGEDAIEELDHRLQGVRCAFEEVKAGEVK